MKKLFLLVLCLLCLTPAAPAAETKYAALILGGGPNGANTEKLLEGLAARNAKATFFLCGENLENDPALAQKMLEGGHELGLQSYSGRSMAQLSRRAIAGELQRTRALLPADCVPRFLRPPEDHVSDGVRQVAEVTGLAILQCGPGIQHRRAELIKDGDVVVLTDATAASVITSLATVDRLQKSGFQFVTLSELARIRQMRIRAGKIYTAFPPAQETLCTFLVPARKVPKESGIRKALCVALPRAKAALPYVPIPAASP